MLMPKYLSSFSVNNLMSHKFWKLIRILISAADFRYGGAFLCRNDTHGVIRLPDTEQYMIQ